MKDFIFGPLNSTTRLSMLVMFGCVDGTYGEFLRERFVAPLQNITSVIKDRAKKPLPSKQQIARTFYNQLLVRHYIKFRFSPKGSIMPLMKDFTTNGVKSFEQMYKSLTIKALLEEDYRHICVKGQNFCTLTIEFLHFLSHETHDGGYMFIDSHPHTRLAKLLVIAFALYGYKRAISGVNFSNRGEVLIKMLKRSVLDGRASCASKRRVKLHSVCYASPEKTVHEVVQCIASPTAPAGQVL